MHVITKGLIAVCLLAAVSPAGGDGVVLRGAGATFPQPLYEKWVEEYRKCSGVRITYEPVGSGGGIRALLERSVDFGGTDAFLSDAELESVEAPVLHIPTCLGAVVAIYNLPGEPQLRFSPDVLADVFRGEIKRWNDPRIRKDNPDANLPDLAVQVVHRSDGSGTSFIFTDYLSQVSRDWRSDVGRGKAVRWPCGIGVEGNPRVADFVKRIPGALGYVSLSYARANGLPAAAVRNGAGEFVKPTLAAVSEAAQVRLPADGRMMITNTAAKKGYPISGFTYLIVFEEQSYGNRSPRRAQALRDFLAWTLTEGQEHCEGLNYSRLPEQAVSLASGIVGRMRYAGKHIPLSEKQP